MDVQKETKRTLLEEISSQTNRQAEILRDLNDRLRALVYKCVGDKAVPGKEPEKRGTETPLADVIISLQNEVNNELAIAEELINKLETII